MMTALTKDELIACLKDEVRILLHLVSKIEPDKVDFRPTPGQRTILELLQYLAIMAPIHLRGTLAKTFDMAEWSNMWRTEGPRSQAMNLDEATKAIAAQPDLCAELLGPVSEEDLRADLAMFGTTTSRGAWLVRLVLNHYAAYRMQLFQYLKAAGRSELNTLNLWVGSDNPPPM